MVDLDYGARIAELRSTLGDILAVIDVPSLRTRITELEAQASVPDLWDDPERAQQVTSALSHAQSELARVTGVERRPQPVGRDRDDRDDRALPGREQERGEVDG